ncbi:hypothetical protein GCM10028807_01550 [Spirosoma daeguense]
MRTRLMQKTTGYLALASLVTATLMVSVTTSVQAGDVTSVNTHVDGRKSVDSSVTTRNTAAKTEATTAPKTPQQHDKKTIGRCWKRLMTMVREVSHAQRNAHK